jgi:glycosyltransferase involved in cell wall biosynthesis
MNIGFDAKRAFFNNTGLGNYSRALMQSLKLYYPEHNYISFSPKGNHTYKVYEKHEHTVHPSTFFTKTFNAYWRSKGCIKDIKKNEIDIYHGLSHELPMGIEKIKTKKVVTIHDLIFERYPNQYKYFDRLIYKQKIVHACNVADKIIAISQQTKEDLQTYYNISDTKIEIVYPTIDVRFYLQKTEEEKNTCRKKYNLPETFLLTVGSLIERKNVLSICKALKEIPDVTLVIIGKGKEYKQQVITYLQQNSLLHRVLFLEDEFKSINIQNDLATIYQSATVFIYPSMYEGFGLPVLEALASNTPCITSNVSSMPEAGGDACMYINALDISDIKTAIETVLGNNETRNKMKQKGAEHAALFTQQKCAEAVMNIYKSIL